MVLGKYRRTMSPENEKVQCISIIQQNENVLKLQSNCIIITLNFILDQFINLFVTELIKSCLPDFHTNTTPIPIQWIVNNPIFFI